MEKTQLTWLGKVATMPWISGLAFLLACFVCGVMNQCGIGVRCFIVAYFCGIVCWVCHCGLSLFVESLANEVYWDRLERTTRMYADEQQTDLAG